MPSDGLRPSIAKAVRKLHLNLAVALFCTLGPAPGPILAHVPSKSELAKPEAAKSPAASRSPVAISASRPATPGFEIKKIEPSEAELGKAITVELSGFEPAWMAGDKLMTDKLVLILDNLELKGLRPVRMSDSHKLVFQLESNPDLASQIHRRMELLGRLPRLQLMTSRGD
jgi:hypothetical protein